MLVGEQLGAYAIKSELGSGGMGKVYAATVEERVLGLDVGTAVALKVIHAHLLETPDFIKRFWREAEFGKTIRDENIVQTYHCAAHGTHMYLVMEYVEGQTLRAGERARWFRSG
jgi:serine/threonine protein kinase